MTAYITTAKLRVVHSEGRLARRALRIDSIVGATQANPILPTFWYAGKIASWGRPKH